MPNRRRLFLVIACLCIVALAIFPVGWLGEVWHPFGGWLWRVFPDVWTHAVGHIAIFGLVGFATLFTFRSLRTKPRLYFMLMLAVGFAQEFFQLLYKWRSIGRDDFRDLGTDLIGAALAFLVVRFMLPYLPFMRLALKSQNR
ncbi:MAG TPA: hypothetical protein VJ020_07805 [Anaerolineales bacterium]|nr:hypothetical protein [Anaerolineales bacterium]